ncbi:MAG TPA: TPM domain-containing protein [Albitalea sp.]|uniref:TPM domain-containing protein n=1 Tax=Piscinibacter sp. TaxID=1903157 RepID=UPI002ED3305C
MNTLLRILKHRWLDETDARRALGPDALQRIEARVAASEKRHRGEIRVCVEAGLPLSYLWRNATARERALTMFGKLRVWDTEDNSGVLIYLLLAEHRIEIVADRGLDRKVSAEQWRSLVDGMSAAFKAGRFEDGINEAIDAVDRVMAEHFPLAPGQVNRNELPDTPVVS